MMGRSRIGSVLAGAGWALLAACPAAFAAVAPAADIAAASGYSNIPGDVVLDNARVLVRAITIAPGQSTGRHHHRFPELLVFVKGGVLRSDATGRPVLWRDGRVLWLDPSTSDGAGSTNTGDAPIELREVVLKPVAGAHREFGYLVYPNIPLEDVFENDRVIVQRFVMNPGQWEGVHGHHPNTLYVYIKGGPWATRTTNPPSLQTGDTPDGYTGWMPAIDLSVGHESGNTGTSPSDIVWIALKE